ncbi:MAG: hypothetical protein NTV09_14240 [Bacteroidetes bacterium]|nr:hypothetical protein [Bacteroidota bacterium]
MKQKLTTSLIVLFFTTFIFRASAQEVYQHISHTDIYDFLDELASSKLIDINSAVKPYARIFIAEKLQQATTKKDQLNKRQQGDLDFYLRDYNKELMSDKNFKRRYDLFYFKDSLFAFTLNPILGVNYFTNDSGHFYHRWNGAEAYGYIGNNFGIYASLRDNHESIKLSDPDYLNQRTGAEYKGEKEGGDYSEMRGGITYTWKWGSFGAIKDHFVWGDNEHGSNIFSGRTPSFAHLHLHLKPARWLDFNYIHGWLVSNVTDSAKNYYVNGSLNRQSFRPKYVAANLATITLLKGLNVSVGNSIVYSDQNVNLAYLIPIFFYKSVDHSQTSTGADELGQNAQMFFNISSRNIKNVHLYLSGFIDEISFSNALDEKKQSNFISGKIGMKISNLLHKNVFITAEYTRTNPITYRHYVTTTTFESNGYNMGNYLGDNSQEGYVAIGYKPLPRLSIEASYNKAQKGIEYYYNGHPDANGQGLPFMDRVYWQSTNTAFKIQYQLVNDVYASLVAVNSNNEGIMDDVYNMPFLKGKQTTISFSVNVGF